MPKIYIGIDNGVSGAIAFIKEESEASVYSIPVKKDLEYTKKAQFVTRVDTSKLKQLILEEMNGYREFVYCFIERPMVNPTRFKATKSALRCMEAVLITLESIEIPYKFVDSKEWQSLYLPNNLKDKDLKLASIKIANREFPYLDINKDNLSDALLICKYCHDSCKGILPKK